MIVPLKRKKPRNPLVWLRKMAQAQGIADRCREADVPHFPAWIRSLIQKGLVR